MKFEIRISRIRAVLFSLILAAFALSAATGCMSVRDRRFNAYSPGNGDPTAIGRVQHAVDDVAETLDTFDTWQENYIY